MGYSKTQTNLPTTPDRNDNRQTKLLKRQVRKALSMISSDPNLVLYIYCTQYGYALDYVQPLLQPHYELTKDGAYLKEYSHS